MNRQEQQVLASRAMAAYFRSGAPASVVVTSRFRTFEGRQYIVIKDGDTTVAVYKIRVEGASHSLRRMARPPKQVAA